MDIAEFLLARITEDRVKATLRAWHEEGCDTIPNAAGYSYPCDCGVPERMAREAETKRRMLDLHQLVTEDYSRSWWAASLPGDERSPKPPTTGCDHCRHAGVDGEEYLTEGPCSTLRLLAAVYADHPDYQPDWSPLATV